MSFKGMGGGTGLVRCQNSLFYHSMLNDMTSRKWYVRALFSAILTHGEMTGK